MKFGAQLVNYLCTRDDTLATIHAVEGGSWNSLWWSDHFLVPAPGSGVEHREAMEGWSLITAAAAITRRVELGLLVTGNTYRNPALLAKMAATVDQISHGRYILGIGAAWFKGEHEAYGWEFPGLRERCDRLEEALDVIKALFSAGDGKVDYDGRYYKLADAPFSPGCYQSPHLPILVGGNGEKRTLRTCAKYADVCNIDFNNPGSPEIFKHKMAVLDRHCGDVCSDSAEIRRTMLIPMRLTDDEPSAKQALEGRPWMLAGNAAYCIDQLGQYIEAGAEEIMFSSVPTKPEHFERIDSEVLSAFR
ncbi:MAG: LLM class F420-dependent oxidoreductase [Gammaproteobacteria bacterium]|nr:LLM class F420-dependent oxidoreductase [Gammaproteobacteria bacterium]